MYVCVYVCMYVCMRVLFAYEYECMHVNDVCLELFIRNVNLLGIK